MAKQRNAWTELGKILGMGCLILLPVVLLCVYTAKEMMRYGDDETAYYLWNRDVTEDGNTRYYETLILGDSSANAAYLPELLSEGTVNLALGGTTPAENYYVLKNWLAHHDAPRTVYLSFMDYHMLYDNMFYERTVYSHLLTPAQERELLKEARACGEENIALEDAEMRLLSYDLSLPSRYLPALLNAGFNERYDGNKANYDAVALHRGAYIGLTTDMYHDTDPNIYESYTVNELFDRYYRRILELCEEHGITARILSLPKTGNSVLTSEYRTARDSYYRDLVSGYEHAMYDALTDTAATRYFHDWEHFNLYGAAHWSKTIRQRYPDDFSEEPVSEQTKQGLLAYMNTAKDAAGLLMFADGTTYAAVAVTSLDLDLLDGFRDTGLRTEGKKVYVQRGADISVTVQEASREENGFCIWTEPDGSNAIVSGETVYAAEIEPFADLTLLIVDTETHMPYVRNLMYYGDGLLGN